MIDFSGISHFYMISSHWRQLCFVFYRIWCKYRTFSMKSPLCSFKLSLIHALIWYMIDNFLLMFKFAGFNFTSCRCCFFLWIFSCSRTFDPITPKTLENDSSMKLQSLKSFQSLSSSDFYFLLRQPDVAWSWNPL